LTSSSKYNDILRESDIIWRAQSRYYMGGRDPIG